MRVMNQVKAWRAKEIIPTYEIGSPEKYPVFLEKRVYQGSSGSIYPNPVIEKIFDEKTNKEWEVIYLENDFIKIMIMPSLGGRIQMAYDKVRERHFVYYNHVIKPALVGVAGPWIAGGIEFNWPQHHRPSTYSPCESFIENNEDGSVTVWVSEIERMFRTKGMAGFTLYPDKAYLEVKGQLYNRTPHPQTFLWWANPAVKVNDEYRSVFPPDVNAVFDHGKRDVSEFPIAKGVYYKIDYSPGTDISLYKNIPVPTSYMAFKSNYDFVGGYEGDTKGGMLHVADHHISPGKKLWTWGNSDFGGAWTRNLTDEDGPYIELMCGVYTDNQPDFSWIQPHEERSFKQYFMPYYGVGNVKNATKDAILDFEIEQDQAILKLYATAFYPEATVRLYCRDSMLFEAEINLSPRKFYQRNIDIKTTEHQYLKIVVADKSGKVLVSWKKDLKVDHEVPNAAEPAKSPHEIKNAEQLYLTGLHLEQYRHATYDPRPYYLEAIRRDPGDIRNNNAMGLWLLKRGKLREALKYFNKAINTLTKRNPNPYDGEPYFNKGVAHKFLGELDEAYGAFYKATWNSAWQDASFLYLSQIACSRNDFSLALDFLEKSLIKNWHNHKSRHLKTAILRRIGQKERATELAKESLAIDQFNFGILYESYLLNKTDDDLFIFQKRIGDKVHNFLEISLDYAEAELYDEAISLLKIYLGKKREVYPMVHYFLAWFQKKNDNGKESEYHYQIAQEMPMDYCFPNRLEEVLILQSALAFDKRDSKSAYYLGNFWYAAKQYREAEQSWLQALKYGNQPNSICHRNLALYYYNKTDEKSRALHEMESAFSLDKDNPRVLFELDQLYKKMNISVDKRLETLENNLRLIQERDDLYIELVSLYNIKGQYEKALELMKERNFHPWEGGEGRVPLEWLTSKVELAKKYLNKRELRKAISLMESTKSYPHNLGEGKLPIAQENDIDYWLGKAYKILGNTELSNKYWQKASTGMKDLKPAIYYNDVDPGKILYQGFALLKLGEENKALKLFQGLVDYGMKHVNDNPEIDYFAVSLPDFLIWEESLKNKNQVHCHYLIGLGQIGLENHDLARDHLKRAKDIDLYHLGTRTHLKMLETNYKFL